MTHDDISDAEIEAVAQATYEQRIRRLFHVEPGRPIREGNRTLTWADLPDFQKDHERSIARAALLASRAALLSEGKKVVSMNKTPRTHCAKGHPIKVWPCGERSCPTCKADGVRRRRADRKRAMWDAAP